jgi:hypothetical protein
MADIRKLKEKLAALLARARDAGSSEAEVEACLKRAEKLMAEYGLTEDEVRGATAESFRDYEIRVPEGREMHCPVVRHCAAAIGRMTGTVFYINSASGLGEKSPIVCVGLEADVEYAMWLLRSLRNFMDDQWLEYRDWSLQACTRAELKAEKIGFIRGYCAKVTERINQMCFRDIDKGGKATGTDIVAVKADAVDAELKRRGINLGRGRSLSGRGHGAASGAQAGAVAGGSASIGRGVGQSRVAIGKG